MAMNQMFLGELKHEAATTRKMLERVPEGKNDWKPHPKSMPLGRLAGHVAEMLGWGVVTLKQSSIDIAPVSGPRIEATTMQSRQQLLEVFESGLSSMKEALGGASDEVLMLPWSLVMGGKTVWTMPRVQVLRSMVFNHLVHHRAQLGVYLRMNDVALPSSYGPSADEGSM
jgi:uncharacterized damage-inducible protein DinB